MLDGSPEVFPLPLPELAADKFPFRGHEDFRGFTQDDYADFAGGVFSRVEDPEQCKWIGGSNRVSAAKKTLEDHGFVVIAATDGRWQVLRFRLSSV